MATRDNERGARATDRGVLTLQNTAKHPTYIDSTQPNADKRQTLHTDKRCNYEQTLYSVKTVIKTVKHNDRHRQITDPDTGGRIFKL